LNFFSEIFFSKFFLNYFLKFFSKFFFHLFFELPPPPPPSLISPPTICKLIIIFRTFFQPFFELFQKNCSWIRDILHRGDRAMIYLFIAGSYTPWLTLRVFAPNGWANQLSWAIWVFAILGMYRKLSLSIIDNFAIFLVIELSVFVAKIIKNYR
jgi:hypothetical protein